MAFGIDDAAILIGSAYLGNRINKSANNQSTANNAQALAAINALDPDKYDLNRIYQYYADPESYVAYNLDDTAYNDISVSSC